MITRKYFYSASRWREDGMGESWQYGVVCCRSWLPHAEEAMRVCLEYAKEGLDSRQPDNANPIRLVAFNRV